MAFIISDDFKSIELEFKNDEESFPVSKAVRDHYVARGFDKEPKSRAEADAANKRDFNGLAVGAISWAIDDRVLSLELAPVRYLFRAAYGELVEAGKFNFTEQGLYSPAITGTAIVAPVIVDGRPYLLSQIKGKAVGSGEVHAGLVSGGIKGKALSRADPLVETLRGETKEEIGLAVSKLRASDFCYFMDERETGHLSIYAVARGLVLDDFLSQYEAITKNRLAHDKKPEVMGVANLPVQGLALTALDSNRDVMRCYFPSLNGLEIKEEPRDLRPPSVAWRKYLSDQNNLAMLLGRAYL